MAASIPVLKAAAVWLLKGKTIAAAVTRFVVTMAASYGVSRALQPKLKANLTTNSPIETTRDPLTPRRCAYGNCRIGGSMRFHHEKGGANNEYLYLIILWVAHPSRAIDALYFNDEIVPLDGSGNALGTYAGLVRCTHHLGAPDQAADANFVAELTGVLTADDRWCGQTYSAIRIKWDQNKFPGGMPLITARGRWRMPYDPRDGAQDPDDPSTWQWTDNWGVCFHDYCRGVPILNGAGELVRLMGINAEDDEIVESAAIDAMNKSDENVAIATTFTRQCDVDSGDHNIGMTTQAAAQLDGMYIGLRVTGPGVDSRIGYINSMGPDYYFSTYDDPTSSHTNATLTFGDVERRYTANGAFDLDAPPSTVVDNFLAAAGGRLHDVGGDLVIRAGAYEPADVDLDTSHLREGGITITAPLSWREKLNYVRGVFSDPKVNFERNDFSPVVSDALIDQDGAELVGDLDLSGFVTSESQAQRLAKQALLRTRQGIIATKSCTLEAALAVTGENYTFTDADLGWDEKEFELLEFTLALQRDKNGRGGFAIDLSGQETAAAIFDWTTDEENVADPAPNTNLADPRVVNPPTNLTPANSPLLQEDGTTVPCVVLTWTAPDDQAVQSGGHIFLEYKKSADVAWSHVTPILGNQTTAKIFNLESGSNHDFRIRARNNFAVFSAYETETAFLVLGDTSPPPALTGVTATAMGGFNRVEWPASAADDIAKYKVQRATNNTFTTGLVTLTTGTTEAFWDDVNPAVGVTYYYRVYPIDASNNQQPTASNTASCTTAAVPVTDVAPTAPSAASKVGGTETVDPDGQGTLFVKFQISVPGKPADAVRVEVLIGKVNDASKAQAIIQHKDSSTITPWVEDQIAGNTYYMWTRSWSLTQASAAVAFTGSPFTLTTGPAPGAPSGVTLSVTAADLTGAPPRFNAIGTKMGVMKVSWTAPSDAIQGAYYWVETDYLSGTAAPYDDLLIRTKGTETSAFVYFNIGAALSLISRVQLVGKNAQPSSWSSYSSIGGVTASYGTANMAEQAKTAVDVSGGTIDVGTLKKSGTNVVTEARTVNGYALSSNVTLAKADVGLSAVPNTDATNASNISSGTLSNSRLPSAISVTSVTATTLSAGGSLIRAGSGGYSAVLVDADGNELSLKWDGTNLKAKVDASEFILV